MLKALRERRRVTALSIARALNRSTSSVSDWEHGRKQPSFADLGAWGDLLGVRLEIIATDVHNPGERRIDMSDLSPAKKALVDAVLDHLGQITDKQAKHLRGQLEFLLNPDGDEPR